MNRLTARLAVSVLAVATLVTAGTSVVLTAQAITDTRAATIEAVQRALDAAAGAAAMAAGLGSEDLARDIVTSLARLPQIGTVLLVNGDASADAGRLLASSGFPVNPAAGLVRPLLERLLALPPEIVLSVPTEEPTAQLSATIDPEPAVAQVLASLGAGASAFMALALVLAFAAVALAHRLVAAPVARVATLLSEPGRDLASMADVVAGRPGDEIRKLTVGLSMILARLRGEAARRGRQEGRLASALAAAGASVWEVDSNGRMRLEPRVANLLGLEASDAMPIETVVARVHPEDRDRFEAEIRRAAKGDGVLSTEVRVMTGAGAVRWLRLRGAREEAAADLPDRLAGIVSDVTDARFAREHMARLDTTDRVTGVANRALTSDRLAQLLSARRGGAAPITVVHIRVDTLRLANVLHGHEFGDALLRTVALRLTWELTEPATVGRVDGADFVALLPDVDGAAAVAVVEQLIEACHHPVTLETASLDVRVAVGVAVYPQDGRDVGTLLRAAETAMHAAAETGRRYAYSDPAKGERDVEQLALARDLARAVREGHVDLAFQVRASVPDGRALAVEAHTVWRTGRGVLSADAFMAVADMAGVTIPIGRLIVERSLAAAAALRVEAGEGAPPLVLHLETNQIRSPEVREAIVAGMARHGIPPRQLRVAIPAQALLATPDGVSALRATGIRTAVKDAARASIPLVRLAVAEVDRLEIDMEALGTAGQGRAVLNALVALGAEIGIAVAARRGPGATGVDPS